MNRKSYSSDRELIEGCIRNDRKAQRELFKRYRDRVFRLIARLIREEYDRDEILQKTFISIFESLKRFKRESSLDTWIYSITTRVCMDRLRKAYKKNIISLSQEPEESMD
ncbi:MAG: RNA polymerase sigma factor, partial [Chitinivibrionales bacterium]